MRKQYDDFTQMKIDEMSRSISDMTFKYINPDTKEPTKVPAEHYKGILDKNVEIYVSEAIKRNNLIILFNQLTSLKEDNEKAFEQALICMDLKVNPKKLRINEQIALDYTYDYLIEKKVTSKTEKDENGKKKDFHFLDADIINTYNKSKNDPVLQSERIMASNELEEIENEPLNHKDSFDRYYDEYER